MKSYETGREKDLTLLADTLKEWFEFSVIQSNTLNSIAGLKIATIKNREQAQRFEEIQDKVLELIDMISEYKHDFK